MKADKAGQNAASGGFTLVETLVVVAIFAVIGVSLSSSFSMGMRVWKRSASENIMYKKAILNLERISRELRASVDYPQIGFFGESDHFAFAALLGDKISNVSYAHTISDKSVSRLAADLSPVPEPENQAAARKIIQGVENVSFSYYHFDANSSKYVFSDSWNYTQNGIPLAVKVALSMENGEIFDRVIFIPVAR